MTQQALLRRDAFVRNATPVFAPVAEFKPGLRRFDIHPRVYGIMLSALATFFASYVAAFSGGAGMPILLVICAICFVAPISAWRRYLTACRATNCPIRASPASCGAASTPRAAR